MSAILALILSVAAAEMPKALSVSGDLGDAPVRRQIVASDLPSVPPSSESAAVPLSPALDALSKQLAEKHPEIPQAAVKRAFGYLDAHRSEVANQAYVAIADFDRPSDEKRLSLIKLADSSVVAYLTAHGSGSGQRYATKFSNTTDSHQSSLGIYLTGEEHVALGVGILGETLGSDVLGTIHGRYLRMRGMESTNSNAESRGILLHGADYVSDTYVAAHGMSGRSWGCPAVDFKVLDYVIDALKGDAVLLIYHR